MFREDSCEITLVLSCGGRQTLEWAIPYLMRQKWKPSKQPFTHVHKLESLKFSSISPFNLEFHIALTNLTWAWAATEMFTAIPCSKIKESLAWISKPVSGDRSDTISTGTASLQMFAEFPCHTTVSPRPRTGQATLQTGQILLPTTHHYVKT